MKKFFRILSPDDGTNQGSGGDVPPPPPPEAAPTDDGTDDFGYKKNDAPVPPPPGFADPSAPPVKTPPPTTPTEAKPATPPPAEEGDSTGYGKPLEAPAEDPPPAAPPAKAEGLGYELELKGLAQADVDRVTAIAKTAGMSKEQAQALVDYRRTQVADADRTASEQKAAYEKAVKQQRYNWQQELRNDPTFGGDKFDANCKRVDRVITEFMPGTKKMLTAGKTMLPADVMRDLAGLANHLYATDRLVTGDKAPPVEDNSEAAFLNDFYK